MKKLAMMILLFAGLAASGQNLTHPISGKVIGKDDNLPIVGATVRIKGTNTGVITDVNGHYKFKEVSPGNVLIFSYIGFQLQEVTVNQSEYLDIYLQPTNNSLNEVVVTGYTTKVKKDVTGSVSTVQMGSAKKIQSAVSGQLLQSKAKGIVVTRNAPPVINQNYAPVNYPAASGTESYQAINENGFNDVKSNPLSTFSVDVDAASYSNVRRFINSGQLPPPDAVRIEEMINYFHYDMAGPSNSEPVAIHTELSSAPWNAKHRLLRIGLKAKTIDTDKLPPSNLVFLLDVSGSMAEANKLPLVKTAMKMLTDQLRKKDKVAIVVYSGQAGLILPETSGDRKTTIDSAIDLLNAGGSTAGGEGIKMAYSIARQNFMKKGNNRIILATDGDFNVGPNSDEDMEQLIEKERDSKVAISIMGFGMGNLKDSKMERMADKGNGNYAYIDNITEARKAFVTEFEGTLFTIARDVKVQIEFNGDYIPVRPNAL